jgi:hypothetical protein
LAAQWLVRLFGRRNEDASIKKRGNGASALGGRNFEGKSNNQIGFGGRGGRDVGEEVRLVLSMWGDVIASIWAAIRTMKKNEIIIHLGLRWPSIDYFTHNNQPKKIRVGVGW